MPMLCRGTAILLRRVVWWAYRQNQRIRVPSSGLEHFRFENAPESSEVRLRRDAGVAAIHLRRKATAEA